MATQAHEQNEDVVKVYSGSVVSAELYQQALKEAGIDSKVVGLDLAASFGTAIPDSVELWAKSEDAEKARDAIKAFEADKGAMAQSRPRRGTPPGARRRTRRRLA